MERQQVFLIQCNGKKAFHNFHGQYLDRTYADEVNKCLYYRHDDWETKHKDLDFGEVKPGSIIIQYCTNTVKSSPGQIKNIFTATGIEKIKETQGMSTHYSTKIEKRIKAWLPAFNN